METIGKHLRAAHLIAEATQPETQQQLVSVSPLDLKPAGTKKHLWEKSPASRHKAIQIWCFFFRVGGLHVRNLRAQAAPASRHPNPQTP